MEDGGVAFEKGACPPFGAILRLAGAILRMRSAAAASAARGRCRSPPYRSSAVGATRGASGSDGRREPQVGQDGSGVRGLKEGL